MKNYSCTKCGSIDVFIDDRGSQNALVCGDCGKWLKWIGKSELPLIERFILNNSDIEKTELKTFEHDLSSQIQRLGLEKEEILKIVESIYK